ncbi:HD domain-containing phosphohydrolase [Chitinivorax sp. B]|uniref:HD-GYP domain-containing protein n=1 Tax=Chitinivorax sp. B TaxID=2502235 RepID=UPI0010F49CC4|nr:HD domain-containing phosphohydrolase [Chitinivorax sp. B]
MSDSVLANVNPHFLERLIELASHHEVTAAEDVCDETGLTLLPKGGRLSAESREDLLLHKLRRPLECCLTIDHFQVVSNARDQLAELVESHTAAGILVRHAGCAAMLARMIDDLAANRLICLSLALTDTGEGYQRWHLLQSMVVAVSFGKLMNWPRAGLDDLATAAALHDVGELYISPVLTSRADSLSPAQWKQIAIHPLIGYQVLTEMGTYNPAVCRAVLEHHERIDGSGYPHRLADNQISSMGQLLSVTNTICAASQTFGHPIRRADIALRIIPRQFPMELVSYLSGLLSKQPRGDWVADALSSEEATRAMHGLFGLIGHLTLMLLELEEHPLIKSQVPLRHLLEFISKRLDIIQRAFSSTGLDSWPAHRRADWLAEDNGEMRFMVVAIIDEIAWRLRELARDIYLRSEGMPSAHRAVIDPVIQEMHRAAVICQHGEALSTS